MNEILNGKLWWLVGVIYGLLITAILVGVILALTVDMLFLFLTLGSFAIFAYMIMTLVRSD